MRGYEMGAVDYVFKPVDPLVLKSKVGVFVDLFRMRRQVEQQALAEQRLREAHYQEQLSRLEAERLLEDAERRQASILRSLPLAIYELDERTGRRHIIGGDLAQFIGAEPLDEDEINWESRVHEADLPSLAANSRDRDFVTSEYRWVGADGVVRHILDQRVAIGERSELRWAGTLLDISERKRLEARLVHSGKLDALGQLTGGVAHDFNNLLAAVLGGLDILQRRLQLGEREEKIVDQMRHAGTRGVELVRRMMAFARQQDLVPTSVKPAALCESVAGLVDHALGAKTKVDWQCPDGGLNLFVDRGQLELALMNLLINARDAMPDGGTIHVAIEAGEREGGPAVVIRVRDEGHGMSPQVLHRVTEPFFTTKATGKGTGLGLSMVAGFVHQSDGELRIDSTEGEGTTITIVLPATLDGEQPELRQGAAELDWLRGKRIMLIDDDEPVRTVLAEQFRDAGGIVDEFCAGEEALQALDASESSYDYALSDYAMPGIDGLQTLRSIAVMVPQVRLALMTGYANEFNLEPGDLFKVVAKPISARNLSRALRDDAWSDAQL
jgi:signal transduction histidine kinase